MKCLFIQVRYYLKPGCRDDFYRRFRDNNIREMSLSEDGNVGYEIYMPLDSGNDICLLEKWESIQAQERHMQTLHYAILCELKSKYVRKVELKKYWISDFDGAEVDDISLR